MAAQMDLRGANLERAVLRGADLTGADLSDAKCALRRPRPPSGRARSHQPPLPPALPSVQQGMAMDRTTLNRNRQPRRRRGPPAVATAAAGSFDG